MDPVRDELLLADDYEDTDDDGESDETDDVSITQYHNAWDYSIILGQFFHVNISRRSWTSS